MGTVTSIGPALRYEEKLNRIQRCSICKEGYEGFGNNAYPFKGRCCDECNETIVIPARLEMANVREEVGKDVLHDFDKNRITSNYKTKKYYLHFAELGIYDGLDYWFNNIKDAEKEFKRLEKDAIKDKNCDGYVGFIAEVKMARRAVRGR